MKVEQSVSNVFEELIAGLLLLVLSNLFVIATKYVYSMTPPKNCQLPGALVRSWKIRNPFSFSSMDSILTLYRVFTYTIA